MKLYTLGLLITVCFAYTHCCAMNADDYLKEAQKNYEEIQGIQKVSEESETEFKQAVSNNQLQEMNDNELLLEKDVDDEGPVCDECDFDNLFDEESKIGNFCSSIINSKARLFYCSELNIDLYCAAHVQVINGNENSYSRFRNHQGTVKDTYIIALEELCSNSRRFYVEDDFILSFIQIELICEDKLQCSRLEEAREKQSMKKRLVCLQKSALRGAFKNDVEQEIDRLLTKDHSLVEDLCFYNKTIETKAPTYFSNKQRALDHLQYHCGKLNKLRRTICKGNWKNRKVGNAQFWDLYYHTKEVSESYGLSQGEQVQEFAYMLKKFNEFDARECAV